MTSKKDDIVALALRLIKTKGFLSLSYDDISKELGITKAAIHYYFEKKEDLGIAVCEKLQSGLVASYERTLDQMAQHNGEPWYFIGSRIDTIMPNEICPISSLQGDYEDLPIRLKEKIEELSMSEIELLGQLVKEYYACSHAQETVVPTLMSVKGALQYRRILGEKIFYDTIENVRKQFCAIEHEDQGEGDE
ncbi:TetR/AcrR family transcriptional regulator [Lacrimispora sp.]|uniref:TetR/AcrR family transcriptional regulator n=1 Tax=Lacrimispora sp. TaxID=2719234 RepID=UPI00289662B4|nr:TetR/AcrR family transcriptional regulator [Lacrimispora sp.]